MRGQGKSLDRYTAIMQFSQLIVWEGLQGELGEMGCEMDPNASYCIIICCLAVAGCGSPDDANELQCITR